MSDTKDLKLSTLPITTPTAPIVLNIPLKPKIDIPAPSNAPRQVDFDILPASEEATIPLILPPEIPQHKQDGGDVVVVVFKRSEYTRVCAHMVSYQRALHASREKCKTSKPKHLPDVIMDRVIKEIKVSRVRKMGGLLQSFANVEI